MFTNKRIMVVAAHPDDELLGLGATMHKLIKEQGVQTHVVILGEGITSRSDVRDPKKWEEELTIHHQNIETARKIIGYHSLHTYNFSDNRFDTHALLDIIKVVEKEKVEFNPDIIFTHHGGDLNIDHQMTFQAVMTATRPIQGECVKSIITFETPSATEWQASSDPRRFSPNLFVEVSKKDLLAKIEAMKAYKYEYREYPHPRSQKSLETLAQNRGLCVGRDIAESFCIVRVIV